MLLNDLTHRRVLFFGGKGGVGKTTLASAAALATARTGRRVLVVSTDPAHNLGHLWDMSVGSGRVVLADNLWGTELDPSDIAREHVRRVADTVRSLMPEHLHRRVDDYFKLTLEAPGTHEAALVDAVARLVTEGRDEYDTIIFDTAPTGHTTRLLDMPRLMTMWTDGLLANRDRADRFSDAIRGLDGDRRAPDAVDVRNSRIRELLEERKARFVAMQEVLTDATVTGFVVVTLPERLPVVESIELYRHLRTARMDVPAVVVNRCRADADAEQARQIDALRAACDAPIVTVRTQERAVTGAAALEELASLWQRALSG